MSKRVATSEMLAQVLELNNAPKEMVQSARDGLYDDFKSGIAANIVLLVDHCTAAGLNDVALRAIHGEFDAQDWEAEEWAASPEGQETFKELLQ